MQAITLEVILRAVFGVRDGERMDRFRESIPRLGELSSPLDWLPLMQRDLGGLTPAARSRRVLAEVDELIYAEISERRELAGGEAQTEMRVVLREVLRRVRLRAPSARPERAQVRHVTVVPARGCRVVVEERLTGQAGDLEQVAGRSPQVV